MFSKRLCIYVLAAAGIASVCCEAEPAQLSGKTSSRARVRVETFGKTPDGQEVFLYEMVNVNGLRARVIDYGAILVSLEVPDRKGKPADITLGFDDLDSYVKRNPLFGAVVGRYANRIANARFTLDGVEYKLTANAGKNHIHGGGKKRFDKVVWKGLPLHNKDGVCVQFTHRSKDGEEGFPGNLDCIVTYTLTNKNELKISYKATTDKPTVISILREPGAAMFWATK
jgi:aldose 1-epimerase